MLALSVLLCPERPVRGIQLGARTHASACGNCRSFRSEVNSADLSPNSSIQFHKRICLFSRQKHGSGFKLIPMSLFRAAADNPAIDAALAAGMASALRASRILVAARDRRKGISLCGGAGLDSCSRRTVLDWELETRHVLHGYLLVMQQRAPRVEFNTPR